MRKLFLLLSEINSKILEAKTEEDLEYQLAIANLYLQNAVKAGCLARCHADDWSLAYSAFAGARLTILRGNKSDTLQEMRV